MKLWKINATFVLVVRAKNENAAIEAAKGTVADFSFDQKCETSHPVEVKELSDLPEGWQGDCIPWGEYNGSDTTIEQYLKQENRWTEKEGE